MKVLFFYLDATHTLVCAILLLNSDLHGEVSDWVLYCKPDHQLIVSLGDFLLVRE